jgi:hypothetical protein
MMYKNIYLESLFHLINFPNTKSNNLRLNYQKREFRNFKISKYYNFEITKLFRDLELKISKFFSRNLKIKFRNFELTEIPNTN